MQYADGLTNAAQRIAAGITKLELGTSNAAEAEGVTITNPLDCSEGLQVESATGGTAVVSGRTAALAAQFIAEELGWYKDTALEGRSLLSAQVTGEIGQIIFCALSIPVTNTP